MLLLIQAIAALTLFFFSNWIGRNAIDLGWVLLYDNWPGPNLNFRKAVSFLQGLLTGDKGRAFDCIFIIHGEELCEINGQATFFQIPQVGS